MRTLVLAAFGVASTLSFTAPTRADDPGRIDAYVTPYYNSSGPVVDIGEYSAGLASKSDALFVGTIQKMKKEWKRLTFIELYVGAIRLYDLGYRWEATYWFYAAQYSGRQFALLADQKKLGGVGDPGFEFHHAQDAFFQLVGPDINGYAFGDIDALVKIIRRVQRESRNVPEMQAIYPNVEFAGKGGWQQINAGLSSGLGSLATSLERQKAQIARERAQNGTAQRFSRLTNEHFPGGY
ncbi:MAG TPA: hypothetical protein VFE16_07725 [Candidatus Cybelea sp.]|nr:hypothetical protein [Candidatus Cybelea sp.]